MTNLASTEPRALRGVVLTGATGFLAGHILDHFAERGIPIGLFLRPGAADRMPDGMRAYVEAGRAVLLGKDGTSEELIADFSRFREQADGDVALLHFAALYIAEHKVEDIADLVTSNIGLTALLADAAARSGIRAFVNVGTNFEFGPDGHYAPANLYAATKAAAEKLIDYYVAAHDASILHLKLYDTYGRDDSRRKLLPYLKQQILGGGEIGLGGGSQKLHLVHVDDIVAAAAIAAERALGAAHSNPDNGWSETAFLPSSRAVGLREIVATAESVLGRSLDVRWGAAPQRKRPVLTPYEGPRLVGWEPQVSLEEGLRTYLAPSLAHQEE